MEVDDLFIQPMPMKVPTSTFSSAANRILTLYEPIMFALLLIGLISPFFVLYLPSVISAKWLKGFYRHGTMTVVLSPSRNPSHTCQFNKMSLGSSVRPFTVLKRPFRI